MPKSKETATSGMAISVKSDERERINRLCEMEGRGRKAQIMWLVDRRLDEIEAKK